MRSLIPLPNLPQLRAPVLKSLHWLAHRALPAAGYQFELRRNGELKLGLWRKRLKAEGNTRLVLIPGFGDTPLSWLPVIGMLLPIIRRRYDEIVLLDFPAYQGALARERGFDSMDLLMERTFDLLDELKPATLAGHSLGGWLASRYSALCGKGDRPKDLGETRHRRYGGPTRLILMDPSGAFGNAAIQEAWTRRFDDARNEGFHLMRPHVFAKEPVWFKYFLKEFLAFATHEDNLAFMRSVRPEHLSEPLLQHVKARTWLMWGELDTLTPPACAPGWLRALGPETQARAVLIRGVGHSPHLEAPAKTATVLLQMLSDRASDLLTRRGQGRWWEVMDGA